MKRIKDLVNRYWTYVVSILGIIGHLIILLGYITTSFKWGDKWIFAYIRANYFLIWTVSLSLIIISIIFWIMKINRRLIFGFSDTFGKSCLNQKWDYVGPWTITDENYLMVTGSDEGGITKKGADWENYTMTFKAKIGNSCIGVIVRAYDLKNYYMFQIGPTQMTPHKRISYPRVKKNIADPNLTEIEMQTGWQVFKNLTFNLSHELNDWFQGKIKVNGQSVSLYIDNELVFHQDSFLDFPKGKVGFRCHGSETGFVKEVKVRLNI